MFCASEPSDAASRARHSSASASRRGGGGRLQLRTLSFGSAKAAFYGGRASFSRSTSSARSARLFAAYGGSGYGSPDQDEGRARPPPSGDVIRRYLSKISSRLRRVAVAPGAAAADLRLRKSRSASATQVSAAAAAPYQSPPSTRRDDSLVEKQDGIASAIAHCKESFHRGTCADAVMLTPPTRPRVSCLSINLSAALKLTRARHLRFLQRPSRRWTRRWCDRGVTQGREQRRVDDDDAGFRHLPCPPFRRSGTPEAAAAEASR
jgi:hypothetical protein